VENCAKVILFFGNLLNIFINKLYKKVEEWTKMRAGNKKVQNTQNCEQLNRNVWKQARQEVRQHWFIV
jgi:hypothetical protein